VAIELPQGTAECLQMDGCSVLRGSTFSHVVLPSVRLTLLSIAIRNEISIGIFREVSISLARDVIPNFRTTGLLTI
jgi:hypothetical protein